jgi:hypothetical protein
MRLSGWRAKAPGRDGINPKVLETVGSILEALGAEADPHCWVTWGDETGSRWTLMAPSSAGLAVVNVRAGGPQEGARAGGRLVRWSKVQLGELAAEAERGHRLVMFQIEGQPIRGTDDNADDVAAFAGLALAGLEGRPLPDLDLRARRRAGAAPKPAGKGSKPAPKPVARPAVRSTLALTAGAGSPKPAAKPAATRSPTR